ncbi:MAG: hypothetical protein DRN29_09890, partial [Thermoplasmata archaeon]
NVPPYANFSWQPINPKINETIYFNSTSYDLDGIIVNYTWNFGDGNISYGASVIHKYMKDGEYNVTLIVRDDDGSIDTKIFSVKIRKEKKMVGFEILLLVIAFLFLLYRKDKLTL